MDTINESVPVIPPRDAGYNYCSDPNGPGGIAFL